MLPTGPACIASGRIPQEEPVRWRKRLPGSVFFPESWMGSEGCTTLGRVSKGMKSSFAILLLASVGVLLTGCGGHSVFSSSSSGSTVGEVLYVTNAQSKSIAGFTIDSTSGALTAVTGSPFSEAATAPLWIAAAGRKLYFSSATPTGIASPTIDSSGKLSTVSATTTDTVGGLAAVSSGSAVVATLVGLQEVQAYTVSNGVVTTFGTGAATGAQPSSVALTPNNSFAFVADTGDDTISAYKFDSATGNLTANGAPVALSVGGVASVGPYRMTIDPAGAYLFVGSTSGYLFVFSIDASGNLTPAGAPVAVAPGDALAGLAVDPGSKYLYVNDRSAGTMYGYDIGSGGALTPISGMPVNSGLRPTSGPESIAIDPGGKFLYVTNRNDGAVNAFTIGSSGAVTAQPTTSYATGNTPVDLTIVH
jgi:6-phosphogluconolactonase